eukprot:GHUV01034610.1.p2 GENE.GHUV01034610.1~~GHUV01034610.1.p2  ORF type:complete len:107 (+),score=23.01 GHUV01034610.1:566-886(+)
MLPWRFNSGVTQSNTHNSFNQRLQYALNVLPPLLLDRCVAHSTQHAPQTALELTAPQPSALARCTVLPGELDFKVHMVTHATHGAYRPAAAAAAAGPNGSSSSSSC